MRAAWACAVVLACSLARTAGACGLCVEDKVAATYEYAVVERAMSQGHEIVFAELRGPIPPGDEALRAWIARAVESVPGVDKGTARVSLEPGAVSFAHDPRTGSASRILAAIDRRVAARRLSLLFLKRMRSHRAS